MKILSAKVVAITGGVIICMGLAVALFSELFIRNPSASRIQSLGWELVGFGVLCLLAAFCTLLPAQLKRPAGYTAIALGLLLSVVAYPTYARLKSIEDLGTSFEARSSREAARTATKTLQLALGLAILGVLVAFSQHKASSNTEQIGCAD